MKKKALLALMLGVSMAAAGCASSSKEAETEKVTEAATEEETTEAVTEEETTEAAMEEETTEAATEEETTEVVTEEETTEAATEEETTEAATEEETTEAVTEEETTEAVTEEETTEAVTEEETTEAETEEETTEAATEEETTEAATEEETTEAVTEEETTEAATEEETTEAVTEEAESESETESETETEARVNFADIPEYVALDYVTLGEYKGLTVETEPIEISEEEIQSVIDADTVETLDEGTVEMGDTVNIDYEGTIDGETFDGGSAEGSLLEIGSGSFIDGFEDGLVGLAVGEEVDLNLTFPENYHSEDLAGKDVVFHVKVNAIERVPELTDEVAAKVADGMTAEEYKESIREDLVEDALIEQETAMKSDLLSMVCENASVDGYPMDYMDYNMAITRQNYEDMAASYGMTLEDLLAAQGMDQESFFAELETYLQQMLSQEMVLKAVAEEEGLEIDDEQYAEGCEQYAQSIGVTAEELEEQYGEKYIRHSLLLDEAMEFLVENANIVEAGAEAESEEAIEAQSAEETTEAATEADSENATEAESETEAESVTEEETQTEAQTDTESESESESEAIPEETSETEA